MSFAASWYRASCALLLLTLYFSMFSFYLPFLLSLSLSLPLFLSLSLTLSLSLSLSHPLPLSLSPSPSLSLSIYVSLWLQDTCHLMPSTKYPLLNQSYFSHLIPPELIKIHQPFTDYLLRLPSSELLEKHLFRSRANRRLVSRVACF